jgi:hypothetical protein
VWYPHFTFLVVFKSGRAALRNLTASTLPNSANNFMMVFLVDVTGTLPTNTVRDSWELSLLKIQFSSDITHWYM